MTGRSRACAVLVSGAAAVAGCKASAPAATASDGGWRPLFDGATFAGWDRYLGEPSAAEPPLGLENDPRGVYSVVTVDGEPAIRISGEVWGALISKEQFCDFQLRAQYRWGTMTWPPLNAQDSGVMYMSTGPLGAVNAGGNALSDPPGSGGFMVSVEYQVTPSDVGAMANLGPVAFQPLSRTVPAERAGAWNQIDIVVQADTAVHSLNGAEVARGSGFSLTLPGQPTVPLRCGKLQLESEGAEIYFRHVEVLSLP